jgi:hypothetical protein
MIKKILLVLGIFIFSFQAASAALPVTNGLKLWLDTTTYDNEPNTLFTDSSCTTPATGDDTEVQCWKDKSGNDDHVTLPPSRGAPQIISSSNDFNTHTVLSFKKSEKDSLTKDLEDVGKSWSGPHTMFIIFRQVGNAANNDAFFSNGYGRDNHFQITYSTTKNPAGFYWRGDRSPAPGVSDEIFYEVADPNLKLYSVTNEGVANGKITTYVDGVESDSLTLANPTGATFDEYRINTHRGYSAFQNSEIAEVIIFNRILSESEMKDMNNYLGVKYGKQFGPTPGGVSQDIAL